MRKTSAMVEAGILAAIAVVMALVAMYVPVMGMFANFVWPLPIIVCCMRNGLKYGVMTLVVASIIIAIIISPIQAFFLGIIFGLMGLVLGECLHRHLSPTRIILYGSIGTIVALILNVIMSFAILDIDPIATIFTQFEKSLVDIENFYRDHGFSEADTKAAINNYAEMIKMMRIILPGSFILSAPMLTFVNYYVAKKILSRLGESFENFPAFIDWIIPSWVLAPYFLSLGGVTYFYINKLTETWMYQVCVNIQTVCTFALIIQAIVLVYWYVKSKNKPKWWAGAITTLIFIIPIFSQIMVYVGAFDMIVDFRKVRKDFGKVSSKKK